MAKPFHVEALTVLLSIPTLLPYERQMLDALKNAVEVGNYWDTLSRWRAESIEVDMILHNILVKAQSFSLADPIRSLIKERKNEPVLEDCA